jgi:hypothetical protein
MSAFSLTPELHDNLQPHRLTISFEPRSKSVGQLGFDNGVKFSFGHVQSPFTSSRGPKRPLGNRELERSIFVRKLASAQFALSFSLRKRRSSCVYVCLILTLCSAREAALAHIRFRPVDTAVPNRVRSPDRLPMPASRLRQSCRPQAQSSPSAPLSQNVRQVVDRASATHRQSEQNAFEEWQ